MSNLEVLENIGTAAVKRLRQQELAAGFPFLINSKDLPSKQSYLEYPDGSISIVTVAANKHAFDTVRKLSADEANALRARFNL